MSKNHLQISWTLKVNNKQVSRDFSAENLRTLSKNKNILSVIEETVLEDFITSTQYLITGSTDKQKQAKSQKLDPKKALEIQKISWVTKFNGSRFEKNFSEEDFELEGSISTVHKKIRTKLNQLLTEDVYKKLKTSTSSDSKEKVSNKPTKKTSLPVSRKKSEGKKRSSEKLMKAKIAAIKNGGSRKTATTPVTVEEAMQHNLTDLKNHINKDTQELSLLKKTLQVKEDAGSNDQKLEAIRETVLAKESIIARNQEMIEILKVHK